MARTKTRPTAAPSAAHAAPDPAPAPDAAAAPGSPAAAVHAALAAKPGSTVADIAVAARTLKPAARDALLAMEKAGTATRARGGKPGIPDTWTLADVIQDGAGPAADPEDGQAGQPADGPAGSLDGAGDDEVAGEAVQDGTAGTAGTTAGPRQQDGDTGDGTSAAPDPGTEKPGTHDDAPASSGCGALTWRSPGPAPRPGCRGSWTCTACGTVTSRTCWSSATPSGSCRTRPATRMPRPRRFTPTLGNCI